MINNWEKDWIAGRYTGLHKIVEGAGNYRHMKTHWSLLEKVAIKGDKFIKFDKWEMRMILKLIRGEVTKLQDKDIPHHYRNDREDLIIKVRKHVTKLMGLKLKIYRRLKIAKSKV